MILRKFKVIKIILEFMFQNICSTIRNSIYGLHAYSQIQKNQVNHCTGTAFMIAPGILVTAAHGIHKESNPDKDIHSKLEVICAPDVGQIMESSSLIAEDVGRDIAFLKIDNPRSNECVFLESNEIPKGTSCGSLGFPLGKIIQTPKGVSFNAIERFQGAYLSAYHQFSFGTPELFDFYETDSLMYPGSSGCPGFLINGNVFGMQVRSLLEEPTAKKVGRHEMKKPLSGARLAISLWVPSMDIITHAQRNRLL
jgi:hypothetical protein